MRCPLPPYGRQLVVSGLRVVLLFVGDPDCWVEANDMLSRGLHCFLCLPDPADAPVYFWPVADCSLSVIVYCPITDQQESTLIAVLCEHQAREVVIRHWPSIDLIIRRPRS